MNPNSSVSEPTNQLPAPPTTTREQDKTLAGQRQVNIIWEVTQATIAMSITLAVVIVSVRNGLVGGEQANIEFPQILSNAFFLIVGFYFSRTNHQRIGGIGPKANETETYAGR